MKKLLITVCLSGLLSVPSVVLGAEMGGASLYGSFRTGLDFGSGDAKVTSYSSRWGIKGSVEVSEGLTAAYKFETSINTANAESAGGNDEILASQTDDGNAAAGMNDLTDVDDDGDGVADTVSAGGPGGRQSYVSLSGGFGTITVGKLWSASYNHYGAALDPTWFKGSGGHAGATYTIANTVSYSSSAGDVSFQIDKVTGDDEMLQFGATAALGPVGVGLGYWKNSGDKASFTGVALSTGAGGIGLAIGLGSEDDGETGKSTDTSLISVSGALGDSGVSYGVQVANSDDPAGKGDQNLVSLVNTLGPGVAIHFEHLDPGVAASSSHLVLRVDF